MTEHQSFFDNVLDWLHEGYPGGVPPKDYFPLLALLKRSLTEDEVVQGRADRPQAGRLRHSGDGRADPHGPFADVIEKEPNPEEIHQVASRLASVGWPLAAPRSLT